MCGFAGSSVGIGGVYCGTVITVPYMGVSGFALIRRLSVVRTAERHGGRSLHWVFADSPERGGDRRGVLRNGTGAVPYIGVLPCRAQVLTHKVTTQRTV